MKKRFVIFLVICICIIAGGFSVLLFSPNDTQSLDYIKVNDIVMTYTETGDEEKTLEVAHDYGFEITILDNEKNVVTCDENSLKTLPDAYSSRQTVVLLDNNMGYMILSDDFNNVLKEYKANLLLIFSICVSLIMFVVLVYSAYIYYGVVKPFDKLRGFAARIAQGNLDTPLEMDRKNIFGAFTESFDIMRDELANSQERERKANQSKKELVASLSHDIKTPVASIRATSELLEVVSEDKRVKEKLEEIVQKSDCIDLLINNLFNATLEELSELKVNNTELTSDVVSELINLADYSKLVGHYYVPECIISCDKLRLGQVFDNIISNSYKYAGTPIEVRCSVEGDYLCIEISDSGNGVNEKDAERCCEKFYRGENSKGKNGSGLGLYISSCFCEKMGGSLLIESDNGFIVKVIIPLSK